MEERVDIMTDFQFKSIIKMVLSIAQKSGDLKAVIAELEKLLPPNERNDADNTNNDSKKS